MTPLPDREEVIEILALLGGRSPGEVTERIRSLELAWLISQVEERYQVTLRLTDGDMDRMRTVPEAVTALRRLLKESTR